VHSPQCIHITSGTYIQPNKSGTSRWLTVPHCPTQECPSNWLLDCFVNNWSKFWSLYLKAPPLAEFDFEIEGPYKSGRSQIIIIILIISFLGAGIERSLHMVIH
jgi:hypothetical protein